MDPIDHSYALAALEHYYEGDLKRMERNMEHWQSEIDANQALIDERTPEIEKLRLQLASIRSLQATIRPSAVMQ